MPERSLKTPVLLIAFNRPELTKQVFEQIRKVKPERLYFAVDGPRLTRPEDRDKCEAVKDLRQQVDWPCELKTRFSEENLGCKNGPYSAMKWFFENEEEGIILEDDVFPDESFFYFCQELLIYYRENPRVGTISGNNFQEDIEVKESYCFSRYSQTWGWATWRRVWQNYDLEIKNWPELKRKKWLKSIFKSPFGRYYWTLIFDAVYNKKINSAWDYQWTLMSFVNDYLTVIPRVNIATNIGIGDVDATHTKRKNRFSLMKNKHIDFPLIHPADTSNNSQIDERIQKNYALWKEIGVRIAKRLRIRV